MAAIFTLHSNPACPACRSIIMTASYLNLKLDIKNYNLNTGEHKKAEFYQMNPQQKVPTIDDNGFYLWESRAILAYMMNKYAPDSSLYPKDPEKRALVDRMLYFDDGTLYKTQGEIVFPKLFKRKPAEAEKYDTFYKTLKVLDEILGKTLYAAGDQITIADMSIIATLTFGQVFDLNFDNYPNITAWMERLRQEIPSYQEINDIPNEKFKNSLQ